MTQTTPPPEVDRLPEQSTPAGDHEPTTPVNGNGSLDGNGSPVVDRTSHDTSPNGEADSERRGLNRVTAPLRRLVEFRGIRHQDTSDYRNSVKKLYDGPRGAALKVVSNLSLHEPLVGRMIRKQIFDVTRFDSILDVGSGAGQILKHLVDHAAPEARIVGFDLSHQMLRRARSRVKSDRADYVAADLEHMPFADNSFDCVTCGWVLEHFQDPVPGLKEMCRVLKPGGSLLLLCSEDTFLGSIVSRTWKCRTYKRSELRDACEAAGLPWHDQLWFTKFHEKMKMGGIVIEARKPSE